MNVGVIGLGSMGDPIARNVIQAGHSVTVYNRTGSRSEPFRALGAKIAGTPGEAAAKAEAVITMLADDGAVESVVFPGILQALPADAIHISMSTISVALSRRLADAHRAKGQHYVAAPVFGRPDAALAKKLFDRCRPLLDAVGQTTVVAGDEAPAASMVKLAGNFMITAVIESLGEAFALVGKSGVDAGTFLDILTSSLFTAPIYKTYGTIIASNKFEPAGFKLPLGAKEHRLLLAAAESAAVPMPLASLVRDRFIAAQAQGLGESDWSAIARISYRDAGL
jgi:3-hydroxyisobutyrate dehydrogenase-like beta-hydroxyacid dehydrogenase